MPLKKRLGKSQFAVRGGRFWMLTGLETAFFTEKKRSALPIGVCHATPFGHSCVAGRPEADGAFRWIEHHLKTDFERCGRAVFQRFRAALPCRLKPPTRGGKNFRFENSRPKRPDPPIRFQPPENFCLNWLKRQNQFSNSTSSTISIFALRPAQICRSFFP